MRIHDFVTSNTKRLFDAYKLSTEFLKKEPSSWEQDENFIKSREKMK